MNRIFSYLKKHYKSILMEILFIILSTVIALNISHLAYVNLNDNDTIFYYSHLKVVGLDILSGHLPQFAMPIWRYPGNASSTFYPWLVLLPFSIICTLCKPLTATGLMTFIGFMLGFNLTYYLFNHFSRNRTYAFTISVLYMTGFPWIFIFNNSGCIIGLIATDIIPVVLIGWKEWVNKNHWKMMTTGLLLLLFIHIPTFIITVITLILLTGFQLNTLTAKQYISILKTVIIGVLSSAALLIPILILSCNNSIYTPGSKYLWHLHNQFHYSQSIWFFLPIIIMVILAAIYGKKLSKTDWSYIAICILFSSITITPISSFLLQHSILGVLAYIERFLVIVQLLSSIEIAKITIKIPRKWLGYLLGTILALTLAAFLFIFLTLTYITPHKTVLTHIPTHIVYGTKFIKPSLIDKALTEHKAGTYADYYPKNWIFIKHNDKVYIKDIHVPKHFFDNSHYFTEYSKSNQIKNIPVATYNKQVYKVTDNHHHTYSDSKHNRLKAQLHQGKNKIQVHTPIMWYRWFSMLITLIGIILLIKLR